MNWLAKEVIAELRSIISKQSTVLDQVRLRKEDAKFEYDLNKKIESEMIHEEWMMKRAIALLTDTYENVYHKYPNLDSLNREKFILTDNEE